MIRALVVLSLTVFLFGCDGGQQNCIPQYHSTPQGRGVAVYRLAVHPLHNPAKLIATYQPLIDYLNREIPGVRFELEASRDYASFEDKVRTKLPDLLLPNPWQTLQAVKTGYSVIAMAGSPEGFKGVFIVRKDRTIRNPSDLKGKIVSYPSQTALAACIMPQSFLHQQGINVTKDIINQYVGSQESAIMNVYHGLSDAGATWPLPWRTFQKEHPEKAAQLRVAWETPHLVNNSFMVRGNMPQQLVHQLRTNLVRLSDTAEGRKLLDGIGITGFIPAKDQDYQVVQTYIDRFEKEIRPVKGTP